MVAFCSSKHEEMVPPAQPEELTGQHVFEQVGDRGADGVGGADLRVRGWARV